MPHAAVRAIDSEKIYLANPDGSKNPNAWVDVSTGCQAFRPACNAVLLESSCTSAAVYKVYGMTDARMEQVNHMFGPTGCAAVSARCDALLTNSRSLEFVGFAHDPSTGIPYFQENLDLLNPRLPKVIAYMLWNHFFEHNAETNLNLVTQSVTTANPCGITRSTFQYSFMIKSFLYAAYCGMTTSALWDGTTQSRRGIIQVCSNGDALAYYAPESDAFKAYLFDNCYLDFPAPNEKRSPYAEVYKEDSDYYFRLNFQICCR